MTTDGVLPRVLAWKRRLTRLGRARIEEGQRRRAHALVEYARSAVPLWRDLLGDEVRPWEQIPIVDRTLYLTSWERTVSDTWVTEANIARHFAERPGAALLGRYELFYSAGLHGRLCAFLYDADMWRTFRETVLRRVILADVLGMEGSRVAAVGSSDPWHTLPRSAKALRELYEVRTFGLQDGYRTTLRAIQQYDPDIVYGFGSAIGLLAEAQAERAISLKPRAVFTSTDELPQDTRQLVSGLWNARVFDSYAATEAGLIAIDCGRGLHVLEDVVHLEEEPDGRIVVTNLVNRVQPIIRYRLPDRGRISARGCECGLPYRTIHVDSARKAKVWRVPGAAGDLVYLHPIVLRSALDRLTGVDGTARVDVSPSGQRIEVHVPGRVPRHVAYESIVLALERAGVDVSRLDVDVR